MGHQIKWMKNNNSNCENLACGQFSAFPFSSTFHSPHHFRTITRSHILFVCFSNLSWPKIQLLFLLLYKRLKRLLICYSSLLWLFFRVFWIDKSSVIKNLSFISPHFVSAPFSSLNAKWQKLIGFFSVFISKITLYDFKLLKQLITSCSEWLLNYSVSCLFMNEYIACWLPRIWFVVPMGKLNLNVIWAPEQFIVWKSK